MSLRFKTMTTILSSFGEQRRSRRVRIAISVLVREKRGNLQFEEETTTVLSSAGGLMPMNARLVEGERISFIKNKTAEELAS